MGVSTAIGNKLNLKTVNGFFDISTHQIIDLHISNSASQNTSGTSPNFTTYNSQTKIGTARVRDMDFLALSGNTGNTSHSHSDYVMYLYDIRTSNNKTGTVPDIARDIDSGQVNSAYDPRLSDALALTTEPVLNLITIATANTGNVSSTNYQY